MLKYPLSSVTVVQVVDLSAITTSAPAAGSLLLEQWPRLSTWPSTTPHVSGTSTVTFTGTLMYCAFDSSVMMHTSAWYSPGCMPAVSTSTVMVELPPDRKSTRLNSSHVAISYAVFCLKKKNSNDY